MKCVTEIKSFLKDNIVTTHENRMGLGRKLLQKQRDKTVRPTGLASSYLHGSEENENHLTAEYDY